MVSKRLWRAGLQDKMQDAQPKVEFQITIKFLVEVYLKYCMGHNSTEEYLFI